MDNCRLQARDWLSRSTRMVDKDIPKWYYIPKRNMKEV